MAITTLLQTQIVDGVGSVVISPVTQDVSGDDWSGQYGRTIQVFGPESNDGGAQLLFTLQLYSDDEQNIELTAPSSQF